ncbi:MAG: metal ABC transporter ATP-binding protein [Rhodospirillaceae bacterium]
MSQNTLLSVAGLTLGYKDIAVVQEVRFALAKGDVLAVVGHNGSGKSTLVRTLLGSLPPLAGRLDWPNGKPRSIAYLGQRSDFDTRFPIRVRDLAAMGSWSDLSFLGHVDKQSQAMVAMALERTGIADIASMPLHKLSAGQLQRALFARTMVQDAPLILLDEPFTAVDQSTEAALLGLIDDWSAEGRTILLVLHDLSAVLQHCTAALLLGKGMARFGPPKEVLTPQNLVDQGYMSAGQAAWIEGMITGGQGGNQNAGTGDAKGSGHV